MPSNVSIQIKHNDTTYAGDVMSIEGTFLGVNDHGIMDVWLLCKAGSSSVGINGYTLDRPAKDEEGRYLRREGTGYGLDLVMRILETVGVDCWEKLLGRNVIVLSERSGGLGSRSVGIASIIGDKVLVLEDHVNDWRETHTGPDL